MKETNGVKPYLWQVSSFFPSKKNLSMYMEGVSNQACCTRKSLVCLKKSFCGVPFKFLDLHIVSKVQNNRSKHVN